MPWNDNEGKGQNGGGPWGQRPGRDQNPWGGPRQNGPEGPDLDELLGNLQRKFRGMGTGGGRGLALLAVLLLGLWAMTGLYRVLPEEHGVILTFGQYTRTQEHPGLGMHLPWPIQDHITPNVTLNRRIEIGFRETGARNAKGEPPDVPGESLMLTGDENIIDIDFTVVWNIANARAYLFEIRDPENTIKKVAESAMREVIGQSEIQSALAEDRSKIENQTRNLMQEMLDSYASGIRINGVKLQKVNPPAQVIDAFHEVQRARADRERLQNEAEAYRNSIIPRARGEAEKMNQEALAYKESVINRATGVANRFNSVYAAYTKAKDVTVRRMYIETMQDVLTRSNNIIIDDPEGNGVVSYLPLDELRKRKTGSNNRSSYPQSASSQEIQ